MAGKAGKVAEAAAGEEVPTPRKGGRKGVLIGLLLAVALGGGGFYAAYAGLIPLPGPAAGEGHAPPPAHDPGPTAEVAFVPIPPLVISLGPQSSSRHLRFAAELEVEPPLAAEVARLMPRVQDVLNSYLRAVDARQFESPGTLIRMRAQMLRRVQTVLGEGRVRDLLVTEFVLN